MRSNTSMAFGLEEAKFENFWNWCIDSYTLDPSNYISTTYLAWDCQLLKTSIALDHISDSINILNIIERQWRGGLCFVGSKRHVKAYNRCLGNVEQSPDGEENYLIYLYANNLYGWVMSQSLPSKSVKCYNDIRLH